MRQSRLCLRASFQATAHQKQPMLLPAESTGRGLAKPSQPARAAETRDLEQCRPYLLHALQVVYDLISSAKLGEQCNKGMNSRSWTG